MITDFFARIFTSVASPARPAVRLSEDTVIFGGLDDTKGLGVGNDFSFWIYVSLEGSLVALPAITYDENLMGVFRAMPFGQSFIVKKEDSVGGMGTDIQEIDTNFSELPVFSVQSIKAASLIPDCRL